MIDALTLEVTPLREQMALLQERLTLDSRNSSKPPSVDGAAGGQRAQRRAGQRKRGAQQGHKGSFRATLGETQVDRIMCPPPPVCDCAASLHAKGKPVRHPVCHVPPIKARADEYRRCSGRCTGYAKPHRAALPAGVPRGQLSPRALALVGVLGTPHYLTQQKTRDLRAQLLGVDVSVGAVSQAHGKVTEALKVPVAETAASLSNAAVLHGDETHTPRQDSGNAVWAVVQPSSVVYSIVLPSRARYVINDLIGKTSTAVVVSDSAA